MKPSRKEIEQIVRRLRRITGQLPDPFQIARKLQHSYEMTDSEWLACWNSCRSVVRRIRAQAKPVTL